MDHFASRRWRAQAARSSGGTSSTRGSSSPSLLALKGNQGKLAAVVEAAVIDAKDFAGLPSQVVETLDQGYGRRETRGYRTRGQLDGLSNSPA